MRYLALDWGSVRVGAAVSDPEGKIAFPLDKYIETPEALEEIKKIIQDLEVDKILIGLPKNLEGGETESTKQTQNFINKLENLVTQPIEVMDERFSSVAAEKTLAGMGLSEKEQRGMKDNIAAQLMLQNYIDSKLKN